MIDTASIYTSSILTGAFLGFCGLIVVVQLVPTMILCYGFVKALITGKDTVTSKT